MLGIELCFCWVGPIDIFLYLLEGWMSNFFILLFDGSVDDFIGFEVGEPFLFERDVFDGRHGLVLLSLFSLFLILSQTVSHWFDLDYNCVINIESFRLI